MKFTEAEKQQFAELIEYESLLKNLKAIPDVDDVGLKFRGKFFGEKNELCAIVNVVDEFGVWTTFVTPHGSGGNRRQGVIFDEYVEENAAEYFASLAPILEQALASCAQWKESIPVVWSAFNATECQMLAEKIRWADWFSRVSHWYHERKYKNSDRHLMEIAFVNTYEHECISKIDTDFSAYFDDQQFSATSPTYVFQPSLTQESLSQSGAHSDDDEN